MSDFKIVHIGNGSGQHKYYGDDKNYKRSSNTIDSKIWKCPSVISRPGGGGAAWHGCHPNCGSQYGDRFSIRQHGDRVYAHRIDSYNNGWGMNLSFKCYRIDPYYENPSNGSYCAPNWAADADGKGVYNKPAVSRASCMKQCDDKGPSCKGITFGKHERHRRGVCVLCTSTSQRKHPDWDHYAKKPPKPLQNHSHPLENTSQNLGPDAHPVACLPLAKGQNYRASFPPTPTRPPHRPPGS